MRIREDESGQMLVMTALSLTILLGFVALAVDVGLLFRAQRNVQIAADAAAIAAALNYQYSSGINYNPVNAADAAAAQNGITNASYVTVNNGPLNGYHLGTGYWEVIISQPNPTYFMKVFGFNTLNVAARSVAGTVPSPACIYVLDPTDPNTLILQGNTTIQTPNCGIQVNSNSPSAVCVTGGSSYVNAPYIQTVGGQSGAGNCKGTPSGTTITSGASPMQDPLFNLLPPGQIGPTTYPPVYPGPPPSSVCGSGNTWGGTSVTPSTVLPPPNTFTPVLGGNSVGIICFSSPGVLLDGKTAGTLNLGTGTTDPSTGLITGNNVVYLFENGVTLQGTVNVYATMDNYQGTFQQGNTALSVYAPAGLTYPYNGIGIMQPESNTTGQCSSSGGGTTPCLQIQFGSSGNGTPLGNLDGLIYAPDSEVYMQDNGGGSVVTGIIAYTLFEKSSTLNVTSSYNTAHPSTTPLSTVAMVE